MKSNSTTLAERFFSEEHREREREEDTKIKPQKGREKKRRGKKSQRARIKLPHTAVVRTILS